MLTLEQYAIRHTMRNHSVLESQAVIKMIAGMIKPEHKVNLKSPDKVILVEIFQVRPLSSSTDPSVMQRYRERS